MSKQQPKVTVLMPAYNASKYIHEAIQSVLQQSFTNFELIIVNDGSVDDTAAIIKSFTDERIRVIEHTINHGVAISLNEGLAVAEGYYIARFDADDVCLVTRLEKQVDFLEANPAYVIVGSDAEYILEDGGHLFNFYCANHAHKEISANLFRHCPFIHSSVLYKKEAVIKAGSYPTDAHNFEDHLLWVNLIKLGKCCNLPEPLIKVRFNPGSVTIDERWRGAAFRKLKWDVIQRGSITRQEGDKLLSIIRTQQSRKIKEGAYHALCSKKFLADNYRPQRARWHAGRAIVINPFRLNNYALFMAGYLPPAFIKWIRQRAIKF